MIRTVLAAALLVGATAVAHADDPPAPTPQPTPPQPTPSQPTPPKPPPEQPAPEQPVEPTTPEQAPALELKHTVVMSAPANVACEIKASIPADANVTLTLFYRAGGDEKFVSVPMTKQGEEHVALIPAMVMTGSSVQYYIEVRDPENKLVTRNGKSTVPNLIAVETPAVPTSGELVDTRPPFHRAKWIASGSAVALFTVSLTTYLLAKKQHDILVDDSKSCGTPPCRPFDEDVDQTVQARGQRLDATYKITLGLGLGAAAAAGYFWYRAIRAQQQDQTVSITPVVGNGVAGASAEVRF